ncbi:MAG: ParA family protein [Gammaproteobacteria bacterium]|nr:ParA family protein [Gammaproteobacteria bacterium]MCP5406192.1 ParA family protein [Chromatiaceae bacterium]MCP5409704.1 ParA family protein [Chromatiaceae bacterium]MCP5442748.1 ParA family protein [Chromatiaceae bacterium]
MRRVVFNQKGGVGKSTITCNLAAISAAMGKRTLVIDLDPQGNSTRYLLGDNPVDPKETLVGFFKEILTYSFHSKGASGYIHQTPFENLSLMPAHRELDEQQSKLESRYKMFKLRDALLELEGYDEIYIDTPPALNFFTRSALIAANACLIPFDCDDFSRQALYALLDNVREIQQDHNAQLIVEGIVVNQFQSRARLPRELVDDLIGEGLPILNAFLSPSIRIRESHQNAQPMVHFDPRHKLTGEFQALYHAIDERAGSQPA